MRHFIQIFILKLFTFGECNKKSGILGFPTFNNWLIKRVAKESTFYNWLFYVRWWFQTKIFHSSGCFGAVEKMRILNEGQRILLECSGWIFHREKEIKELWLFNGQGYFCVPYDRLKRVDVESTLPLEKYSLQSGFKALLPIAHNFSPTMLDFIAKLSDGGIVGGSMQIFDEDYVDQASDQPKVDPHPIRNDYPLLVQFRYKNFLLNTGILHFKKSAAPTCSIIIHSVNDPALLYQTLSSLLVHSNVSKEVIVIAPHKIDLIEELLSRVEGVIVLRASSEKSLTQCLSYASLSATADAVLFLRSGYEILSGLESAVPHICNDASKIGAITGPVVSPTGDLRENMYEVSSEGKIISSKVEGSDLFYWREKQIAATSLDCLLISKSLLLHIGGLPHELLHTGSLGLSICLSMRSEGYSVIALQAFGSINHNRSGDESIPDHERSHILDEIQSLHRDVDGVEKTNAPEFLYLADDMPIRSKGIRQAAGARILRWLSNSSSRISVGVTKVVAGDWNYVTQDMPFLFSIEFISSPMLLKHYLCQNAASLKMIFVDGENANSFLNEAIVSNWLRSDRRLKIVYLDRVASFPSVLTNEKFQYVDVTTGFNGDKKEQALKLDASDLEFEQQLNEMLVS